MTRPKAPGAGLSGLHRTLLAPILRWRRGETYMRYVAGYRQRLRQTPEALAADRRDDLHALLMHAWETVPFHRERMQAAGVDPTQDDGEAVLAALPPLTKRDIFESSDRLISSRFDKQALTKMETGGTTSRPSVFLQDSEAIDRKQAQTYVLQERMGWRHGGRVAYLWGATQDMPPARTTWFGRLKQQIMGRVFERALHLPAGILPDETLDRYIEQLKRFRPHVLQAYPSAGDLLARRMRSRGIRLHIPLTVLTAEPVLDSQRDNLREAIGGNILSFYGSRENGWVASDCPEASELHINSLGCWLETTEDGRLLITDLVNRGMPLIRYEIGDRAVLGTTPCSCGDPRPRLERIEGRTLDAIPLPSGKLIPGIAADLRGITYFEGEGIDEMQFVLVEPDRMEVRWTGRDDTSPGEIERAAERAKAIFLGELEIVMVHVERIPPEPNGKVRWVKSEVPAS